MTVLCQNILIPVRLLNHLIMVGLTHCDVLITCFCLQNLDEANCLKLSFDEIAEALHLTSRTVRSTIKKLEKNHSVRNFKRFDFTRLLQEINKTVDKK